MKRQIGALCLLSALHLTACGDKGDNSNVTEGDDDDQQQVQDPNGGLKAPAPWTNVSFTTEDVEINSPSKPAGDRGKLLRDPAGTLYYAYYRARPNVPECDIALFAGGPAPTVAYDLVVAVKPAGAVAFSRERVPLATAGAPDSKDFSSNPLGVDATFDRNGALVLAFPGGGDGQFLCASGDLIVATRSGTNSYSFQAPVLNSSSCCAVDDAFEEMCPSSAGQDACRQGDNVGGWAAIVKRASNALAVSYGDSHFTTDEDGQKLTDYELWQDDRGVTGIRPWSGKGRWSQLREIDGRLITATSNNPSGSGAFVYVQQGDGTWVGEDQSFGATVGERLQLEIAPNGTVGLAYYAIKDNSDRTVEDLWLCESLDGGVTFPASGCSRPETATLIAGQHPSLAYDSQSRPVLSYYYCGSNGCPNDGLRVAWRDNTGKWWKYNIRNIANNRSGYYSSVVIDPATDAPIIAFQDLTRGAAMIAYGSF